MSEADCGTLHTENTATTLSQNAGRAHWAKPKSPS